MKSTNKIALITGGTNGIGKETAFRLALEGINVTIVGQTPEKCILISEQLQTKSGNQVDWIAADLSTMNGIESTARTFQEQHSNLHVLINNAGAFFNHRIITEDGFEKTFALNYLNYFYLTHLLMNMIQESSPARIVNVSSMAHSGMRSFDFDNLQGDKHYFMGWDAYSRSKLCNLYFTYELSRKLSSTDITVNALHPGYIATGFASNNGPIFRIITSVGAKLFAMKPESGAKTIIYLAISPEIEGVSGKYFRNSIAIRSSPLSYDTTIASKLWQTSLKMITK
jgi:NAD(P)-dependent dehydrogenase (short-subunit alcohol dehydrogenase family)